MKAFAIAARDAGPEFQELPDPQPASGEVVVAVQAASLNGIDAAVASGAVWDFMPHSFPVVLGRDFAGAVVALGEGVDDVAVGDRVAGTLSPLSPLGPAGTFGEFATVPIDTVAPIVNEIKYSINLLSMSVPFRFSAFLIFLGSNPAEEKKA